MRFVAIPTEVARAYQAGGLDANGQVPERKLSDGGGNPCRHCLKMIPEGAGMLVLAHRPFPAPQPYAEVGPIFWFSCGRGVCKTTVQNRSQPKPFIAPIFLT